VPVEGITLPNQNCCSKLCALGYGIWLFTEFKWGSKPLPSTYRRTPMRGARRSLVVKAPEGRGFDTRWSKFLNLPNPSGPTRPWGLLSL
jgi:hypothetical protein